LRRTRVSRRTGKRMCATRVSRSARSSRRRRRSSLPSSPSTRVVKAEVDTVVNSRVSRRVWSGVPSSHEMLGINFSVHSNFSLFAYKYSQSTHILFVWFRHRCRSIAIMYSQPQEPSIQDPWGHRVRNAAALLSNAFSLKVRFDDSD
jgi:hypothetical protein